jgi:hypothetical protein
MGIGAGNRTRCRICGAADLHARAGRSNQKSEIVRCIGAYLSNPAFSEKHVGVRHRRSAFRRNQGDILDKDVLSHGYWHLCGRHSTENQERG